MESRFHRMSSALALCRVSICVDFRAQPPRAPRITKETTGMILLLCYRRPRRCLHRYSSASSVTSADKAGSESTPVNAAVNHCAIQNQMDYRLVPQAIRTVFIGLGLMMVCASFAHATNYYVDCNYGSNGNAGTSPQQAWRTLLEVGISSFQPGDINQPAAGLYLE